MKQKTHLVPVAASALLIMMLAGCYSRDRSEGIRSVEWYVSHKAERAEQLNECMSNRALDAAGLHQRQPRREYREALHEAGYGPEDVSIAPPPVPYP